MRDNELAPIIIKKKKIIKGGGHHGGAWKVAYADFVTAMMAFFLLMWLLNATTEVQRKGIADYFNPTIAINRVSGGGNDMFAGDSIFIEDTLVKSGTGAAMPRDTDVDRARGEQGDTDNDSEKGGDNDEEQLTAIQRMLSARSGESMVSTKLARHIVTRLTDEGLVVEFFDLETLPLFEEGTNRPTDILVSLTEIVGPLFAIASNRVAVNGYTRSQPIVIANNPVWDLSTARADIVRRLLETRGLPEKRVQRISGFADQKPFARNPMAVRNNRIEMILLRSKF